MNEPNYFQNPNSPFLLNIVQEGDGLELLRDLKDETVQLVIFDPQYKLTKETTDKNYHLGRTPPHHYQNQAEINKFCQEIKRVLKKGGWLLLWINQRILLDGSYKHWLAVGLDNIQTVLVWIKGKGKELLTSLGQSTRNFIHTEEYCLVIRKKPYNSPYLKKRISNIFCHFIHNNPSNKRHNVHTKPYEMIKAVIQQLTNEGDLVVDPCAGSFVSLKACQNLKRNFLGTDLTLRKLMKFNLNKERSRMLLKQESTKLYEKK